jgi:hypothetical protein
VPCQTPSGDRLPGDSMLGIQEPHSKITVLVNKCLYGFFEKKKKKPEFDKCLDLRSRAAASLLNT